VQRNRDMLGTKGQSMLPSNSKTNYFSISDEKSFQNRLENMQAYYWELQLIEWY
jgi:hypothetical protein